MKFRPRDAYLIFDMAGGSTLILFELSKSLSEGAVVRFGSGGFNIETEFRQIPHEKRQQARILHGDRLHLSEIPFLEADLFHEIAFLQRPSIIQARKHLVDSKAGNATLSQSLEEAENNPLTSFLAKRLDTIRPNDARFTEEGLNRRLSRLLAVACEDMAEEWITEILRHAGIEFSAEEMRQASAKFRSNQPPQELVEQFEGKAILDEAIYSHWREKQEEQLQWLRQINFQRETG